MTIYLAPALEQNVSWEVSANTLNLPAQGLNYGDIALNSNGDTYITLNRSYQIQTGESSRSASDAFIAFVSEDGNIEWKRQLTNNSDDYQRANDLLQGSNGDLYVKFYSHENNQVPQYIIDQISNNGEILNRRYGVGEYDIEFIPESVNLLTAGSGNSTGNGYAIDENSNLSVFDQRGYEWHVQYGAQKTSNGNIVFNGYANDISSDADASNLKELPDVYGGNLKFTREVSPQGNLLWANELFTSGYAWSEFHSVQSSRASSKGDGLSGEDAANEENYLSVYTDSSGNKSISEQVINPVYLNKGNSGLTAIYPEDGTKATIFPGMKIIDKSDTNSNYLSRTGTVTNSEGYPQYFIDRKPLDSSPSGTPLELEGQSYYDTFHVKQDDDSYLLFLRRSTLASPIQVNESKNSFSTNSSNLSAGKKLFKLFSETIGETIYTISTAETVDLLSVDGDILKVNEYYTSNENLDNTYDFTVIALENDREAYREDFSIQFEDIESSDPTSPSDLLLSASTFDENISAGSVVANLSSTDEDSGDTHTYSLVSGDGSEDNGSFEIVGDELKIKDSPDFETKSSYSIRVETKDSGGLTLDKSFTLSVNDVEEITPTSTTESTAPSEPNPANDINEESVNEDIESPESTTTPTLTPTTEPNPANYINEESVSEGPDNDASNIHRFYNAQSGVHFYTPSDEEKENIMNNPDWGYQYEGVAYQALANDGVELFRFYNSARQYHFLTKSPEEAQAIISSSVGENFDLITGAGQEPVPGGWGYKYEGRTYRVADDMTEEYSTPVYRFFQPQKSVHFYSSSLDEVKNVIRMSSGEQYMNDLDGAINAPLLENGWGYQLEGVAWWI